MTWIRLPGAVAGRRESMAVVRWLAACTSTRSDPAGWLAAWASEERPAQARRLERFATVLAAGGGVEDAIRAEPDCLTEFDRSALRFAERSGLVQEVLGHRLDTWQHEPSGGRLRIVAGYTLFVACHFLGVAGFIGWVILPRYERILDDFGLAAGGSMRLARVVSELVATLWPAIIVGLLTAIIAARASRLRRALPWLGRGERRALALEMVAVASRAGRRPDDAARLVAECLEDRRLARRLAEAAGSTGGSAAERLARAGFCTRREREFVEGAERLGGGAWALATLARSRRDAGRRMRERLEEGLVPAAAVLMGGLVLVEASAILLPLVRLVRGLS